MMVITHNDNSDLYSTPRLAIHRVSSCATLVLSALCHYLYHYPHYSDNTYPDNHCQDYDDDNICHLIKEREDTG